jgi:hypothetical protein
MVHLARKYFFAFLRLLAFGDILKAVDRADYVSIAMARLTGFAIAPTGMEVLLGLRRGDSGVSEDTLLIMLLYLPTVI